MSILALQEKWATKRVLLALSIAYLIFPFYLLPLILPEGKPLDLYLFYSPQEAFALINSYGDDNRASYALGSATIDMIYPLCYSTFLGLGLTFILVRSYEQHEAIQYFRLFPYTILFADVAENMCIISLLLDYPNKDANIALLATIFTSLKWFMFFSTLLLLTYFIMHYYQKSK